MIPGGDPGMDLYVRNKRPAGLDSFTARNVVLFVHGATYPAETAFDLALEGRSWMDCIARAGYDVYLVDVRGYGRSTCPAELAMPAAANRPIVRTETAVRDFAAAADFVRRRRNIGRLTLLGWSWGTVIVALYTARHAKQVERIILHAPAWLREGRPPVESPRPLGAYRVITPEDAMRRWATGIPAGRQTVPVDWQQAWIAATFPQGRPLIAPNGVVQDAREYWFAGKPLYDPADIKVPALVILGEWDADTPPYMAQALFARLVNAHPRRLVTIGEGTHMLMLEKNRTQLFREAQLFLDEPSS